VAIRSAPQQSILDCLPTAVEIADLRIINKDLNFIQANIKRADDLSIEAMNATDYSQLVSITEKFSKLTSRASDRAETLKEFTKDSNPLTEVNSSSELLEKVQILSETLNQKTNELGSQFYEISSSKYDSFNSSLNSLSQSVNSISSHEEVTALFPKLESLLTEVAENANYLNTHENAEELLKSINEVVQVYDDKADSFAPIFLNDISSQVSLINQKIEMLRMNIDGLNTKYEVDNHLQQLSDLRDILNDSVREFINFPESNSLILNMNDLSIATYAKVQDIVDGSQAINKLLPIANDSEALSKAVTEASFRTNTSVVDNTLMSLIDKPSELSAKVFDLAAQFESSNLAELKISAVKNIDKNVARLERAYLSSESSDPIALANSVEGLSKNIESQFDIVQSVDPASQGDYILSLSDGVYSSVNSSDFSNFINTAHSISNDVMMNSRQCVDSAFKDFTRAVGSTMEKIFDPLLYFLAQFEQLLLATPWPLFLAIAGALAWLGSKSYKVTVGVMLAFFAIGFLGMWTPMISTVTMISAATLLCLTIGIPLGIWMSKSDRAQSLITPVLDIMQTIPSFVYLIPVVMLLGIGKVPGLIAVCIYAMPPIVRLTNLGIRLVNKEAMEAADAFGATYRQRLFMVQIPLALPNIFAGVNQTIMMALSMVVIASMIGVTGLGLPVLQAVQNQYLSLGLLNGLAIVALAIIFDRVSQAFGTRIQKHRSGDVL
jgi:glycine betaine/proline transport system permease protein